MQTENCTTLYRYGGTLPPMPPPKHPRKRKIGRGIPGRRARDVVAGSPALHGNRENKAVRGPLCGAYDREQNSKFFGRVIFANAEGRCFETEGGAGGGLSAERGALQSTDPAPRPTSRLQAKVSSSNC